VYGESGWHERLSAKRLESASELKAKRRQRGEEPSLLDCIQFCDKRDLALGSTEIRERMQLGQGVAALRFLKAVEAARDRLAHSGYDMVEGSSWEEFVEVVEWIERTLEASDELVEENARESAAGGAP